MAQPHIIKYNLGERGLILRIIITVTVGMNIQELIREFIMQKMRRLPEQPLQAGAAETLRPQPQQALPGRAVEQAGPAVYIGGAI